MAFDAGEHTSSTTGPSTRLSRRTLLKGAAAVVAAGTLTMPGSIASAATSAEPPNDLDAFILDRMHRARVPGLAAAVIADGGLRWSKGYGRANIRRSLAATADTPFMLASVSKTVMAVALMQVVESGALGLDDDIDEHLPFGVRNPNAPAAPITARMLLTHTSSLRDNWRVLTQVYVRGDSPVPLGSFLRDYLAPGGRFYDSRRNFGQDPPLTEYRYCNVGAALGGYLVEAVTGTPFDRHCDERIFGPLGMRATGWHLADLGRRSVAMPYRFDATSRTYRPYGQYGYPDYPDGELRTGAAHLARFLGAFAGFGTWKGTRILGSSTAREMRRRQFPRIAHGQGLIWYYERRGADLLLGHNGGDSGVNTRMFFRPRDGVGVIVLANGDGSGDGALAEVQDRLFEVFGAER